VYLCVCVCDDDDDGEWRASGSGESMNLWPSLAREAVYARRRWCTAAFRYGGPFLTTVPDALNDSTPTLTARLLLTSTHYCIHHTKHS